MRLADKTIIITGASSGIGEAAACLFAAEGAKVVLGARRGGMLKDLADRITSRGGTAEVLAGDVRDAAYAEALVELAKANFGGLDAAFNNAGMMGELLPVESLGEEDWRQVIDTNLTSAFLAAKYQIPAMKRRGGGAIVYTSSFVGYSNAGLPGMATYAASKAGMIGLTQSLAAQHGADGIRVNALLPGGTLTAMAGDDPEGHAYIAGLHPLGRMGQPEEIAEAVLFLLSGQASFVTGSAMLADGGISVRLG